MNQLITLLFGLALGAIFIQLREIKMQQTDIDSAIADNTAAQREESAALATLVAKIDSDVAKILASSQDSPGLDFTVSLQALKDSTALAKQNTAAMAAATASLANADGSAAAAPAAPVEAPADATVPADSSADASLESSAQ